MKIEHPFLNKDNMPMVIKFLGSLYKTKEEHAEYWDHQDMIYGMLISKEDWMLEYPTDDEYVQQAVEIAEGDPAESFEWFKQNVPHNFDEEFTSEI